VKKFELAALGRFSGHQTGEALEGFVVEEILRMINHLTANVKLQLNHIQLED